MKYFITAVISLIIGGILGAVLAYFVLRGYHDYEIEGYKTKVRQKQNIAKVYTLEYYKLANVLGDCRKCEKIYYGE